MCCIIQNYVLHHLNGSIATSQQLTMKHGKEIFKSHMLQQPNNLIATFENHLLQHLKNHCNTEKQRKRTCKNSKGMGSAQTLTHHL
jgi:hypothetical protein